MSFNFNALKKRYPIDANDVLVWRFDEVSDPIVNEGTGGSDGDMTWFGTSTYKRHSRTGLYLPCVEMFSGSGQYRGYETSTAGGGPGGSITPGSVFTISVWVYLKSLGPDSQARIMQKLSVNGGWSSPFTGMEFNYTNDGTWYVLVRAVGDGALKGPTNNFANGFNLTAKQWNHLGGTYDGTTFRTYINGEEAATSTVSFTPNWGSGQWLVGGMPSYTGQANSVHGLVSDARIASVARPLSWWQDVYRYVQLDGQYTH